MKITARHGWWEVSEKQHIGRRVKIWVECVMVDSHKMQYRCTCHSPKFPDDCEHIEAVKEYLDNCHCKTNEARL